MVFTVCDTDCSGCLDVHELRFALNAFGLFPGPDYIEDWMQERESLSLAEFIALLNKKRTSAPSWMLRPRAVPYARRGVSMWQLDALQLTFLSSGWLTARCEEFNRENRAAIANGDVGLGASGELAPGAFRSWAASLARRMGSARAKARRFAFGQALAGAAAGAGARRMPVGCASASARYAQIFASPAPFDRVGRTRLRLRSRWGSPPCDRRRLRSRQLAVGGLLTAYSWPPTIGRLLLAADSWPPTADHLRVLAS